MNLRYVDKNNATYAQMCERNAETWKDYIDQNKSRHKNHVKKAIKWLSSRQMAKKEVAMACEIQLIYKPYYFFRITSTFCTKSYGPSHWKNLCVISLQRPTK